MKTKFWKFLSLGLAASLAVGVFAACAPKIDSGDGGDNGGQPPQPAGDPSLSLSVQCTTLEAGELNAFVVNAQNFAEGTVFDYQVAAADGKFQSVMKTEDTSVAYRCNTVGTFSVRVSTSDPELVSQTRTYTVTEGGGATFGRSPSGEQPTHNVDLNYDNGEYPYIEHKSVNKISDEYAFVKGVESTGFLFTATIDILGNNGDDQNPKAGLFCKAGNDMCYFAFDVKPKFTTDDTVFVTYDPVSAAWQWPGTVWHPGVQFRQGERHLTNSLTMLRDGTDFYLWVNDDYLGKVTVNGFTEASAVGTYTMAQNAIFSEYSCYTRESAEYEAALEAAKALEAAPKT